jgi:hypothetical protein|tara:strand:+ start:1615 stop:2070 length:456 start_codon:yes stop_codon:yes gene_type:complete
MRLEKISTEKTVAKPTLVKEGSQYKVLDVNGVERKVFEDIDLAKLWMKKHTPELKEGKEPVLYTSELMEGVLDATDEDGWMAKSQLYKLSKYSVQLHGMINDTDNLEPWVQAKITKASEAIGAVMHYMEYLEINDYPEQPPVVVDDMPEEM